MNVVWLGVFWVMQAVAQVIFKFGSDDSARWLSCFLIGNVFGASSIWFLMLLYKAWNPNLALGIGTGGGFLAAQIALAVVFRSHISPMQYAGALAITGGMVLFILGAKG